MSLSFKLAPMSPLIKGFTIALWLLPLILSIFALVFRQWAIMFVVLFMIIIYGSVWLWFRPSRFVVANNYIDIIFPGWRRSIPIEDVYDICIMNQQTFQQEFGWSIRIGAGGLWGGFGWLWTSRRGFLEFYISQLDELVLISRLKGNNLLITPENPDLLVATIEEILS